MSDVEKVPAPGFDPVTCPYCGDKWSLPGCSGHCYGSPDPARPDEWSAAIEADIVAWRTIAEIMRDTPEAFSAYSAAGCAREFLRIIDVIQPRKAPRDDE